MKRIVILGAGVMGTAFSTPASDGGFKIDLVGTHLDRDHIDAMQNTRIHPRLKAEIGSNVTPYQLEDLGKVLAEAPDLIIVGVSTPGIRWAAEQLGQHMTGQPPMLLLTKGIDELSDRVGILPDLVAQHFASLGKAHGPIGAVGGPCIAGELAVRRQTAAILGFADAALAQHWAAELSTSYYHLASTDDLIGLEICAALKNFYAIGVSVPSGRLAAQPAVNAAGLHNETASYFNQAVTELSRIVAASGGRAETAFGLAGLGDLHVTTQAGRNSRLGKLVGEGMTYAQAMAGPLKGETVEGALVAKSLAAPLSSMDGDSRLTAAAVPLAHAIVGAVAKDLAFDIDQDALHRG